MIGRGVSSKQQIRIGSKNEMDREMKRIQDLFRKKESEENWAQFDQALKNIKLWATMDKIHQFSGFVDHIKLLQQPIISSLTSERTRLSGTASELLQALSQAMQRKYEIIHELFMPTLIRLFARSNKVHVRNTLNCFKTIVQHSKVPRTTHRLCSILKKNNNTSDIGNKTSPSNISKSTRYYVTECLNTVIQSNATSDLLRYVDDIEAAITNTAMDPAPEVRGSIRMCYKLYCEKIPERASKYSDSLSPEIKKYLLVTPKHRTSSTTTGSKSALGKRSPANITTESPEHPAKKRHVSPSPSSATRKIQRATPLSVKSASATTSDATRRKPALKPSTATTTRHVATSISMTTKQKPLPSSSSSASSSSSSSLPRSKSSTASYLAATTSSAAKKTAPLFKATLRSKYIGQNSNNLQLQPNFRLEPRVYIRGKPPMRQKKGTQGIIEDEMDSENGHTTPSLSNTTDSTIVGETMSTGDESSQQEDTIKAQD